MNKSRLLNIFFAVVVAAFFFGILEASLHLAGFEHLPDDTPLVVMRDFQRDTYKTLYRFDEDTLWMLKPGAAYDRRNGENINSLGFRSPEMSRKKKPGTLRVACLGDSSTFGLGMPRAHIYTELLENYLSRMLPRRKIEVINGGVVGFTSTQALARFRRDILPLKPDVVVVTVGAINEVYKMPLTDAQRIELVKRGAASRNIRDKILKAHTGQLVLWLVRKMHPEKKKSKHQNRAPLPQFRKDLSAFASEAEKHGILLVLVSPHRKAKIDTQYPELAKYSEEIRREAAARELTFVDVHSYFRMLNSEEVLFRDDFHPSATGHNIIAQMLAGAIVREANQGRIPGYRD